MIDPFFRGVFYGFLWEIPIEMDDLGVPLF